MTRSPLYLFVSALTTTKMQSDHTKQSKVVLYSTMYTNNIVHKMYRYTEVYIDTSIDLSCIAIH